MLREEFRKTPRVAHTLRRSWSRWGGAPTCEAREVREGRSHQLRLVGQRAHHDPFGRRADPVALKQAPLD